jgi:hypothetical protein
MESHHLRPDHATPAPAPGAVVKWYGTRLSTVILVRRATGEVLFVERDRLRANSLEVQSTSTSADAKDSGVGPMVSIPEILSVDEGRATQRVFRFAIGK